MRLQPFFLVLLAACGSHSSTLPDDASVDAASIPDASGDSGSSEPDASIDASLPDAGPPPGCSGNAPSCFGRDAPGCSIGLGCTSAHFCAGFAARCIEQGDEEDCQSVQGCAWNGSACKGMQRACNTFGDPASCDSQPGCASTITCSGTITKCNAIDDEPTCLSQAACVWTEP